MRLGCKSYVLVGLRLPDFIHGQSHDISWQQYLEQHAHLSRRPGHVLHRGSRLWDHARAWCRLRSCPVRRPHGIRFRWHQQDVVDDSYRWKHPVRRPYQGTQLTFHNHSGRDINICLGFILCRKATTTPHLENSALTKAARRFCRTVLCTRCVIIDSVKCTPSKVCIQSLLQPNVLLYYHALGKNSGYDRVRNSEIGFKDFELDVVEEAFTSEHWLVRIYKVNKLPNHGI